MENNDRPIKTEVSNEQKFATITSLMGMCFPIGSYLGNPEMCRDLVPEIIQPVYVKMMEIKAYLIKQHNELFDNWPDEAVNNKRLN